MSEINSLYLCSGFIVVMVIMFIFIINTKNKRVVHEVNNMTVGLPSGIYIIKENELNKIEQSMKKIHDQIKDSKDLYSYSDGKIKLAMMSLAKFIDENKGTPCTIDLESDESTNDSNIYIDVLLDRMDLVIKMLRRSVCRRGHLDIVLLYEILKTANKKTLFNDDIMGSNPEHYSNSNEDNSDDRPKFSRLIVEVDESITGFKSANEANDNKIIHRPSGKPEIIDKAKLKTSCGKDVIRGFDPRSDHYTVNVNACAGSYNANPIDDMTMLTDGQVYGTLSHECVKDDINFRNALDGHGEAMLDCGDDCTNPSNYMKFYNKFDQIPRLSMLY